MNQVGALKKNRMLVKQYLSPVTRKEARSSIELVRNYLSESNKKLENVMMELPENHKRKQLMLSSLDAIQGQNNLSYKDGDKRQPIFSEKISSKGYSQTKHLDNYKQENNPTSKVNEARNELEPETSMQEEQDLKKKKSKGVCPTMSIGEFLKKQGIHMEGEKQLDDQPKDKGFQNLASPPFRESNHVFEDDSDFDEQELGIFYCDGEQVLETANIEGISKNRKSRGKTTCKEIHARSWDQREAVTFDAGQAVGPTQKRVKDLTSFLGTIGRKPEFISLTYTNWHAVPNDPVKKRMWKYVQSKFIIPKEGKKWVMDGIRDAWRRHKTTIKKKNFDKYENIDDMIKNRPEDIPETQFKQLIAYWSLPPVQAMCNLNSENHKKQKWRHRMGPINFGRVRVELREKNENKEESTQSNVFVATRMGRKGKELDSETQAVIDDLTNRQLAGETAKEAFRAVFGKEQPGHVRCYGRTITKSSLKRKKRNKRNKRTTF